MGFVTTKQEASVSEVSTIGLDLAKHVFQAHGADASGKVVFRKRLRREKVLEFFAGKPACLVAMEACSSAHHWACELARLGHSVPSPRCGREGNRFKIVTATLLPSRPTWPPPGAAPIDGPTPYGVPQSSGSKNVIIYIL